MSTIARMTLNCHEMIGFFTQGSKNTPTLPQDNLNVPGDQPQYETHTEAQTARITIRKKKNKYKHETLLKLCHTSYCLLPYENLYCLN